MDKKVKTAIGVILIALGFFVIIIIAVSLSSTGRIVAVCNYPYIQVGEDCCLDQNSNSICDNDEISTPPENDLPKYSDCDKFLSQSEKQSCKREVAIAIGDMSYCPTAYKDDPSHDLPENIDYCLDNVFFANSEKMTFSDCDYYQTSYKGENCRFRIIVEKKEYALCGILSNDYNINRCYSNIAKDLKDKSICEEIQDVEKRYECIDEITKYSFQFTLLKFPC